MTLKGVTLTGLCSVGSALIFRVELFAASDIVYDIVYGACSFTVVLVSPVFFLFWQSRWASFRTVVELMANLPVRRGTRIKQRQQQKEHNSLVASESILVEGKLDSELDADLTLA